MTILNVVIDSIVQATSWAFLIGVVGAIWQFVYAYTRDKSKDREAKQHFELEKAKFENQSKLESQKFEHQKALETSRFKYEQLKWREQLSIDLALKHVDARLAEYPQLWTEVKAVAKHNAHTKSLKTETARQISNVVELWRYSKGGLLAEETTRDAALAFQTALWNFDETSESFDRIRQARLLLRAALRADMGLGEDALGQSIFDAAKGRNKIEADMALNKERPGPKSETVPR